MADNNKGFASPNYDENTAEEARSKGGQASSSKQDMSKLGRKGGKSQGQDNNPANFANDPEKASDAGRKGGSE